VSPGHRLSEKLPARAYNAVRIDHARVAYPAKQIAQTLPTLAERLAKERPSPEQE
jgi:hypothetical protein